ncbi:hypothetical protein CENSYa_0145 [Cenarchaeum symbiosum A]|uniref:Uncharacterized protein n=1 Tax=Cenarchaeum symbiosum (strain A) TaxID=414004 RepID=A0RTX3_CENSY|nr:hypothetical protein CENSYa_0145 [Cenarchaeum symbiosum A]
MIRHLSLKQASLKGFARVGISGPPACTGQPCTQALSEMKNAHNDSTRTGQRSRS